MRKSQFIGLTTRDARPVACAPPARSVQRSPPLRLVLGPRLLGSLPPRFSAAPPADTSLRAVSAPHSVATPPPTGHYTPHCAAPGGDSRSIGSNACPHLSSAPPPPLCSHSRLCHCRLASLGPETTATASGQGASPNRPGFRSPPACSGARRQRCASCPALLRLPGV